MAKINNRPDIKNKEKRYIATRGMAEVQTEPFVFVFGSGRRDSTDCVTIRSAKKVYQGENRYIIFIYYIFLKSRVIWDGKL